MGNTENTIPEETLGMGNDENNEASAGSVQEEEINEENLFDLVDSGKITIEEANRFLASDGSAGDILNSEGLEGQSGGEGKKPFPKTQNEGEPFSNSSEGVSSEGEGEKPFRVFNTQEDFQRFFDKAWNERYGKKMREQEEVAAERDSLLTDLGELLGVSKDDAARELAKRKLMYEAQRRGVENPEDYAMVEALKQERDNALAEVEKQRKAEQTRKVVSDIRESGARIKAVDPSFDIDSAMNNPEFAKIVFSLYGAVNEKAVEIAYNTVYGGKASGSSVRNRNMPDVKNEGVGYSRPARPVEGGVSGNVNTERKPVDFSRMSDKKILDIQKRVLMGEKIDL